MGKKKDMLQAIIREIEWRHPYLDNSSLQSIYLGGGTPSLLDDKEINSLIDTIGKYFQWDTSIEITLEANPDDLNPAYLKTLKNTAINRLSVGVQSFDEQDLQFMNRAHSATEALNCIKQAQDTGFDKLTIDLIYGAPTTTHQVWQANLQTAFDLSIPHLSCYALTVEPRTALHYKIKKGQLPAVEDEHSAQQFEILLKAIASAGYEQYEISNFCIPPAYAVHNSNYWKGVQYLGIGPSAHSFNGRSRQWNIANNNQYIKALSAGQDCWEKEILSLADQYNEYIMTALRTKWGVEKKALRRRFATQVSQFEIQASAYIQQGWMQDVGTAYILSAAGKLLADSIIADFFREEIL